MEHTKTTGHQLAANASACERHNVEVRVDRINSEQSVAFCSVEQLHHGFFRRNHSASYLAWYAEQALAPLMGLGIVPLVSVQHKSLKNLSGGPKASPSLMDWIRYLWDRLGLPLSREGFSVVPVTQDPFGWRKAMHGADGR